ncbi:META domain-containing protein [Cellulomonas sp. NPDC089187]|uniref:META domain-containing protein n=1 Tax=Cellulomonas sp. NPDC089187 TaxID=3154970 RepID=UPI003444C5CA
MDEVVGRSWMLTDLSGDDVGDRAPVLHFEQDGQVYGHGGVNRVRGTWSLTDGRLVFGPMVTTLMAGPPQRMAVERALLGLLATPLTITVAEDELLLSAQDGHTARLVPAPPESELA